MIFCKLKKIKGRLPVKSAGKYEVVVDRELVEGGGEVSLVD